MKASVIVPAWGETPYLDKAKDGLAAQSCADFEVIVCQPPPDERNAGAARNCGLGKAKGDWLFFLDADDLPEPDFVSAAVDAGERTGADLVVFRADEVDNKLGTRSPMPYLRRIVPWADGKRHSIDELGDARFTTFGLAPWNKAVRRSLVEENSIRFQSISRSNDLAFSVEVAATAGTFTAIDRSLVGYRVNNSSSLQWNNTDTPKCFYEALLEARRRLAGRCDAAFRVLAEETIRYNLHSIRRYEEYRELLAYLTERSKVDGFGVTLPSSGLKAANPFFFKACRALETLRDRGSAFCLKRLAGKIVCGRNKVRN